LKYSQARLVGGKTRPKKKHTTKTKTKKKKKQKTNNQTNKQPNKKRSPTANERKELWRTI